MSRIRDRMTRVLAVITAGGPLLAQAPAGAEQPPTREAAAAFVRRLDALVDGRNWPGVLAAFARGRQTVFARALEARVEEMKQLEGLRSTSGVQDYFIRGGAGIAVVQTRLRYDLGTRDIVSYIVLGGHGGDAHGLFAIEAHPFAAGMKSTRSGSYECAACNFGVSFGADWLAVPRCPVRSGCMEAVWLVSLTHDLHIDVAVHVGETALTAEQAIANCLRDRRFSQWVAPDQRGVMSKWRPTCTHLPQAVTGCRYTTCCKGELVAELNMVTLGRLRYLMVVRGPEVVLGARRAEVERILDSFTILDPDLAADKVAVRATHVHSGCGVMLPDNVYRNPTAKVELRGPAGWTPVVRAGSCLFEVAYGKGEHNSLRARAWGGPWTRERVEGIVRRRTETDDEFRPVGAWTTRGGFELMEAQIGACGLAVYAFRDDLLLILNGFVQDPEDLGGLSEAMRAAQSLRVSPK